MIQFNNTPPAADVMSLSQLNERIRLAIGNAFPGKCWVRAEMSDVRVNSTSGHCYLEFIEKEETSGNIVAKARGSIWARTFGTIKPLFEQATGQPFASGLKVLVCVAVEFHKLYGYCLNVTDIDPSYTLGDLVRRKQQTIKRLKDEGIFDLNREIPFPLLPQRIAVVTSPTAAGYEDFVDQLIHNQAGYAFAVKLFAATMQGEKTEESIIAALDDIAAHIELFDVVVLIRGGGSAADLNCFDSYNLAYHCAQFPLPVITGIGHERDDSIVDMVAHTRMKTPTAVAACLIAKIDEQATLLRDLQNELYNSVVRTVAHHRKVVNDITVRFPILIGRIVDRERSKLEQMGNPDGVFRRFITKKRIEVDALKAHTVSSVNAFIEKNIKELDMARQLMTMASPDNILRRGYTLTTRQGKIVKSAAELNPGDDITLRFTDGKAQATVDNTTTNSE